VSLKGSKLKVADVPEGTEDELRFFLDGVVQQANATHIEPEDESGDDAEDGGDDDAGSDGQDDADARMTARFRDADTDTDSG
jgi:hypothetical protein